MTVVVCRAFFKLNGQGRMPEEEMWAETWIGRAESQPCEGKFWSEGIAALKYKEARVAGSQWWGRWEKQGQVMWRFAGCDWGGMMGIQGSPSQGREWLGPEPRRAVAAYLPLQFLVDAPFFPSTDGLTILEILLRFLSQSKLCMWLLGDLCDSWW